LPIEEEAARITRVVAQLRCCKSTPARGNSLSASLQIEVFIIEVDSVDSTQGNPNPEDGQQDTQCAHISRFNTIKLRTGREDRESNASYSMIHSCQQNVRDNNCERQVDTSCECMHVDAQMTVSEADESGIRNGCAPVDRQLAASPCRPAHVECIGKVGTTTHHHVADCLLEQDEQQPAEL